MGLGSTLRQAPGGEWAYRRLWRLRHPCLPPAGSDDSRDLYDLQTAAVLSHVLGRASVCVDGGAHRGSVLEHMVRFAPAGRHHAVEPLPHLAGRLRAEFPGVAVHQCALAERDGEAAFTFVENDPGYSGLRRRAYVRTDPVTRQLAVRTRRLDDLLPHDCPVAAIKLDLEGGEYHALLGARATIRRCRPVIIFEFGLGAADFYGVTPEMMWGLLVGELGLPLTTQARWLRGAAPLGLADFVAAFRLCRDFYFLAAPAA
jgi:FkbM family methyltransferase